jgi:hypothetical protein
MTALTVPFGRSDESRHCAGNCFAYDNDKPPPPAVHKEKLGHALSLNMMRCEAIHDGEIFPNHRVLTMLTMTWLAPGPSFLLTHLRTENDYLIYLEMNWEYKIYSLQKFSSNDSLPA